MSSVEEQMKIRIISARDLLKGLRHPELAYRIALLRTIRNDPAQAFSLGRVDGRDVVDELLALCEKNQDQAEKWEYVFTALGFDDKRTVDLAKRVFLAAHDHRFLVMAAKRLSLLSEAEKADFLLPILLEDKNVNRCRLCANLLAGNSLMKPRACIRVSALADRPCRLPPVNRETLDAWIAELSGPYPRKTRDLLLARGNSSVAALLAHWGKLPAPIRLWAFQEAIKKEPSEQEALIRDILRREKEGELVLAALKSLVRIPCAKDDEELITPYCRHGDPAIRAAAIGVTAANHDWADRLLNEPSGTVRLVIIDRIAKTRNPGYLELLATLLEETNYQIRAAATNAMVALGPPSLPTLQKLLLHRSPVIRAAAVQALIGLGQDEWLEAQLPRPACDLAN